jgi:hypothetical protein
MLSEFAVDLWQELRQFMSPSDRSDAADLMVQTLINHDESVDDIVDAFRSDADVKQALSQFNVEQSDVDTDDYNDESDDDDQW